MKVISSIKTVSNTQKRGKKIAIFSITALLFLLILVFIIALVLQNKIMNSPYEDKFQSSSIDYAKLAENLLTSYTSTGNVSFSQENAASFANEMIAGSSKNKESSIFIAAVAFEFSSEADSHIYTKLNFHNKEIILHNTFTATIAEKTDSTEDTQGDNVSDREIILSITDTQVGSLNLPTDMVMNYLSENVTLPENIKIKGNKIFLPGTLNLGEGQNGDSLIKLDFEKLELTDGNVTLTPEEKPISDWLDDFLNAIT